MGPALANEASPLVRDNFGSVGLIDMPNARMAPDGELSVGGSYFQNTQHYNFGFQILPWLETSFRYSGLQHFDPAYPVYYDRSFAVKARLWDETAFFPAMAIGINDIVGTGIYSGEYLVASKHFGDLDASVGIGWGRLGDTALFRNPLSLLSATFKTRVQYPDISPGSTSFNSLFHGPSSGLFGGLIWHTPINRLSLVAEYSSDTYQVEALRGNFKPRTQMNYGVSYQVTDGTTVGLDWLYGRSIGGSVSFQLNPTKSQYPAKLGAAPIQPVIRPSDQQEVALQTLMHQRQGTLTSAKRASLNRTNFVDALWRQNGIRDVEVSGHSLLLTAFGDTGRRCIVTAQLAQSYGGNIETVVVRGPDGSKPVQCVTAFATTPSYQNVVLPLPPPMDPVQEADPASIKTIDAVAIDPNTAMRAIRNDARDQRITIEALALTDSTAIVYYNNFHYFAESDAIDRLTRILMKNAPSSIEKFRLIAVSNGIPQQEINVLRGPEERKFTQTDALDLFADSSGTIIAPPPLQNTVLTAAERHSYPRFSWSLYPQLRQELFDPNNPFAIQLTAAAVGSMEIFPGLSFNGEAETSVFDNFNIGRQSESELPHVRSDFLKYFAQGKTGIGLLDSEYRFRLVPTVFAVAKAGYLESMFAGGGGEILWRPEGQRWAMGVDAYEVWQRGFDRLLDLQRYHVFTGHVSLYYASPWHDLNFMLSAGQYLAGDRGLTFQVTRRFSTGVEIGAFMTKTNVSAQQFGEGSFDKGIVIRIPLDWALPIETQGQWGIDLRPIQRDGGQRLMGDTTLFDETRRTSRAEISAETPTVTN
ncbi:MAG: YjbH domain-containing protein [Pseudomonadota bacterium]